jgi:tRNA(Arg) A34 adenosine deaminase TadA
MSERIAIQIRQPDWLTAFERELPGDLIGAKSRMAVAISLSEQNMHHQTGGPFGALVVNEKTGEVIAMAVNRVESQRCSSAHAEMLALSLAQQRLGTWNLADPSLPAMQLVTSCEPCAMCMGAIPWSGVRSVLCGATKADAEAAGFDEGDRPLEWVSQLRRRGIAVVTELLREDADRVLQQYAKRGQTIYHPTAGR